MMQFQVIKTDTGARIRLLEKNRYTSKFMLFFPFKRASQLTIYVNMSMDSAI